LKIEKSVKKIKDAADSDDIKGIIRSAIDDAIDANIMGFKLRMFLHTLHKELDIQKVNSNNLIELNNYNRAIHMVEHFEKILGMNIYNYELN